MDSAGASSSLDDPGLAARQTSANGFGVRGGVELCGSASTILAAWCIDAGRPVRLGERP